MIKSWFGPRSTPNPHQEDKAVYISLANSRARGFAKWSAAIRPGNDDDDSGGATPIGVTEPPDEEGAPIEEPPHPPWAVPGVGSSL